MHFGPLPPWSTTQSAVDEAKGVGVIDGWGWWQGCVTATIAAL